MKKFTSFCLGLFCLTCLQAQEVNHVKTYFTGASFSINYQKNYVPPVAYSPISAIYGTYSNGTSDIRLVSSSIYGILGKQLDAYWAWGGFMNIGFEDNMYRGILIGSSTTISQYQEKVVNFGAGIFSRYIINPENILQAFLQPSLSYRRNNRTLIRDGVNADEIQVNNFELASRAGFLYLLNESIRLNISIGTFYLLYGHWNSILGNGDHFFLVGTNINFNSLQFGAEYMF